MVRQVLPETPVQLVLPERVAPPVRPERREHKDPRDPLVLPEVRGQPELKDPAVRRGQLEQPV